MNDVRRFNFSLEHKIKSAFDMRQIYRIEDRRTHIFNLESIFSLLTFENSKVQDCREKGKGHKLHFESELNTLLPIFLFKVFF